MRITEELKQEARRNQLAYGMTYVQLPNNTSWEHRPWMHEVYNAVNPWRIQNGIERARRASIIKPTQSGLTTSGLVKSLHMMTEYDLNVAYSLPRDQDVTDLVRSKLNPMIRNSPYISDRVGSVNAVKMKQIGSSFMYFMSMTTEPRMLSADAVINDEIDLSDPNHLSVMPHRMDDSPWKLIFNYSTPTVKGYGIDALYAKSCQFEWMIKCPHCGKHQVLDWNSNIRVEGMKLGPDEVNYVCRSCDKILHTSDFLSGEWVAHQPDLINFHKGYHLSQMMFFDPFELYLHSVDPNSSKQEFFRKRLGVPYSSAAQELGYDWLMNNLIVGENNKLKKGRYYIGADQGNTISIVIIRVFNGKYEIVFADEFEENGFDLFQKYSKDYGVSGGVLDADPNRNTAATISRKTNGQIKIADYHTRTRDMFKVSSSKDDKAKHVTIRRSQTFDYVADMLNEKEIFIAEKDAPRWARLLFTHVGNLRRDVEENKTPLGIDQKVTWRSVGPDHLAHALLYAVVASLVEGNTRTKVRIIGAKSSEKEDGAQKKEEEYTGGNKARIRSIRIR